MNTCHADTRFTMEHAAAVASHRAELALPVPVAEAPPLELPEVPVAEVASPATRFEEVQPVAPPPRVRDPGRGRPALGQRPSVVRRLTKAGRAFFIAQTREISGERTYLGSFDTHEAARQACLTYMNTGEKPPSLQPGRPKGEWSKRSPEERRAYHRQKQQEYTQRSREKHNGTVPQRYRAVKVPMESRPPRNSRDVAQGPPRANYSDAESKARIERMKAYWRAIQ